MRVGVGLLARLHASLNEPLAYAGLMRALGAEKCLTRLVREHFHIRPGDSVLDAGCGPGLLYPYLPSVAYLGLDIDAQSIAHARTRHPAARFEVCDLTQGALLCRADVAVAIGVLHHLSDPQVRAVLGLAERTLRPGGRLVTVDPAFDPGQHRVAALLARADRGRFVRSGQAYRELARAVFPNAALTIRHDLLHVPYTHAIVTCRMG